MRLLATLSLSAALLFPFCLAAQTPSAPNKKVTITKRTIDKDGSESTEIIVKKGKAAENFDAARYVSENRSDKTQVEVRIEEADAEYKVQAYGNGYSQNGSANSWGSGDVWAGENDNKAHLGVSEDSDEDADQPGIVVQITRGSAADRAGLRDNDKIMSMGGTSMSEWSDLSSFIAKRKPGEEIEIKYERNGKPAQTTAKLTRRSEVKNSENTPKRGFLGVTEMEDNEDKPGVSVQIIRNGALQKAGLVSGDILLQLNDTPLWDYEDITDFMAYTQPGETVAVTYEHKGERLTKNVQLNEEKSWDWTGWEAASAEAPASSPPNINFSIRDKAACLGVYTDDYAEDEREGAHVNDFTEPSAAQEAGLQNGDVILSINKRRVNGHEELWEEIARYKPEEKIEIELLRGDETQIMVVGLKACKEKDSRIQMFNVDEDGSGENREFFVSDWNDQDQQNLASSRTIPIRKAGEGSDAPRINFLPGKNSPERQLMLDSFRAEPINAQGHFTVAFRAKSMPTVVSLHDPSGHQLFREELNAFDGNYIQRFDLSAYASGRVIVRVTQADAVFSTEISVPKL